MRKLFATLNQRRRPEDVAQMIVERLGDNLSPDERKTLKPAARGSLKNRLFGYTSMLEEFVRPAGFKRQVAVAVQLFENVPRLNDEECDDPNAVESFVRAASAEIKKAFGENDFRSGRLNHLARESANLDLSRRRYNKLFRLLARMESKLLRHARESRKCEFQIVGKSGLASKLSFDEFATDENSACFIAYLTARANLRSEFTIDGQQRAFDEIARMLLARCRTSETANWWAIAHAFPSREVLAHLSDEEKGALLGRWFEILKDVADLLEETWAKSNINRETMVVRRGNDSSTWNNTAGAWNRARDNWIALLYGLGMENVLEQFCFGKVLRLMAADVVAWHKMVGNTLDPNTSVWAELPLPWEVLAGKAVCTRATIEAVCRKHNLDAEKSGWTHPRPRTQVAEFRPTPEFVHGVTVNNPLLAKLLKQAGYFSGKKVKVYAGSNADEYKQN